MLRNFLDKKYRKMEHFTPKILKNLYMSSSNCCLLSLFHSSSTIQESFIFQSHSQRWKTVSLNIMMNYVQVVTERYSGGLPGGEQNEENPCLLFKIKCANSPFKIHFQGIVFGTRFPTLCPLPPWSSTWRRYENVSKHESAAAVWIKRQSVTESSTESYKSFPWL